MALAASFKLLQAVAEAIAIFRDQGRRGPRDQQFA
jgi:hypothetical protein